MIQMLCQLNNSISCIYVYFSYFFLLFRLFYLKLDDASTIPASIKLEISKINKNTCFIANPSNATIFVLNPFYHVLKSQLCVFKHRNLQMFGLKF